MPLLAPGDAFPELTLTPVNAAPLTLPTGFAGRYAVIVFYRGAWCPFCNAQLHDFQRAHDTLAGLDTEVVALSADDEPTTREMVTRHALSYPVAHSADVAQIAQTTGAFTNRDPAHLQSTGFILDPAGRIITSVYSSGAIGRLAADDVTKVISRHRQNANASRPN